MDYERHGSGICRSPCSGDDKVSCGGHYAFDLFYTRDEGGGKVFNVIWEATWLREGGRGGTRI